jgi:ABC-type transport system substrate-binding protein
VYWTCDATFAERVGYCNEEFDRLAGLGDTTVDPAERLGYYEEAGQILIDDVPGPFLFNDIGNFVVKPNVTGYTPTATEVQWPGNLSSLMTLDKTE